MPDWVGDLTAEPHQTAPTPSATQAAYFTTGRGTVYFYHLCDMQSRLVSPFNAIRLNGVAMFLKRKD